MNWMQKLLRLFNNDEAETKSNNIKEEIPTKKSIIDRKQKWDSGREMEAKVMYQYPKGAFRFPVIPDDEIEINNKRSAYKQEVPEEKDTQQHQVRREPTHKPRKKEPEKRGTRPFQPSVIPSPIYGFKGRPQIEEQDIEKELVLLAKNELENRGHSSSIVELTEIRNEDHFEQIVTIEEELEMREEDKVEQLVTIEEELKIVEESSMEQIETTEEELEIVEESSIEQIETTEEELEIVEESSTEQIETTEKEPEIRIENDLGQKESTEEVMDIREEDSFEEIEFTEVTPEIITDDYVDSFKTESQQEFMSQSENEHEISCMEENVSSNMNDSDGQGIQSEPRTNYTEDNQETPKSRSSIPFNVIMLNHDKRKLMEKERSTSTPVQQKQADTSLLSPNRKEIEQYYTFPSIQLLTPPIIVEETDHWIEDQTELLNKTLVNFNVGAKVVNVTQGPSVTRFEVQPEPGVKVNKITNLSDDIKLCLAARDIRIEAPIPGKHTVGIEVPNKKSRPVFLREIVGHREFNDQISPLTAVLGLDISGKPIVTDLRKMPHGLIAGATGSGKSVCINTILVSLLYKASPEELKLLLIDPKMVELAPYNHIPHLVSPVITDVKAATASLKWAVEEMERRYELFAHSGVRDISRFNELAEQHGQYADKLPYIVIIIDELADLMMVSPADVEEAICRIAQKARACGIHLIIATQRPSVDVITGLIKANIPTRIAFSVSSQVDSRTIIDISGAEKLLGKGDMLFLENGSSKPVRLQGTFVSDQEIDEVVAHTRKQGEPDYLFEQEELLKKAQITEEEDELFYEACEFVIEHGGASSSLLQRRFKIGYNRAARLIDMMEQNGFISESRGSKPRDVLITNTELEFTQEKVPR